MKNRPRRSRRNGAKVPNSVPLDLERTAQLVECASAVEDQVVAIFDF